MKLIADQCSYVLWLGIVFGCCLGSVVVVAASESPTAQGLANAGSSEAVVPGRPPDLSETGVSAVEELKPVLIPARNVPTLLRIIQRNCDLIAIVQNGENTTDRVEYDLPSEWITDDPLLLPASTTAVSVAFRQRRQGASCSVLEIREEAIAQAALAYHQAMTETARLWVARSTGWAVNARAALTIALQVAPDAREQFRVLQERFIVEGTTGDLSTASQILEQLENLPGTPEQQFWRHWMRGNLERWRGDFAASLVSLQAARQQMPNGNLSGLQLEIAAATCDAMVLSAHPEAFACLQAALTEPAVNIPYLAAVVHNNLGGYYAERQEFEAALAAFEASIAAASAGVEPRQVSLASNNAAWILGRAGFASKARDLLVKSLAMAQASGEALLEAHTYQVLGEVATRLQDVDGAQRYFAIALAQAELSQFVNVQAWSQMGLGAIARDRGQSQEAIERHIKAKALIEASYKTNPRALADGAIALARTYLASGDPRAGLVELATTDQLQNLSPGVMAIIELLRAQLQLALGQLDAAQSNAESAERFFLLSGNLVLQGESLQVLAKVFDQTNPERSIGLGARAIETIDGARRLLQNPTDTARFGTLVSTAVSEQVDRLLLRHDTTRQAALVAQALQVIETDRHHSRQHFIRRNLPYRPELESLRLQIAGLNAQVMRSLDNADVAFANELRVKLDHLNRAFESFAGAADTAAPVALNTVTSTIPRDRAYVSFRIDQDVSLAFVVLRDEIKVIRLAPVEKIAVAVEAANERLLHLRPDYQQAINALTQLVWKPLALPAEVRVLHIAPHGPAHHVPFAALNVAVGKQVRPLMLNRTIELNGNWDGVLPDRVASEWAPASIAVVAPYSGEPLLDLNLAAVSGNEPMLREWRDSWVVLPWSRREAREIKGLFARDRAHVFRNSEATYPKLVQATAVRESEILHFATHGFASDRFPDIAGLILPAEGAPDRAELVNWREFQSMPITAKLIVLNGCETAAGELLDGGGILGLTRAFLGAGATEIVSTQWPVADRASARFAGAFYRSLLDPATSTARAVQLAQTSLYHSASFSHPFFWGGYRVFRSPEPPG